MLVSLSKRVNARAFSTSGAKSLAVLDGLKGRSLMRTDDYSVEEFHEVLALSHRIKEAHKRDKLVHGLFNAPLMGKSISMIFQKRSTRTRVSTETGAALLGMHPMFLGSEDVQLGVNESLRDSAIVLSRYNSLILARVFGHEVVTELAKWSSVPVINALSNLHHPLQALADIMTLREALKTDDLTGKTIAWVGDGNNVFNDLMLAGVMSGCHIRIATPGGEHVPSSAIVDSALKICKTRGKGSVSIYTDPVEGLKGADCIVTDTWVSMGQEAQKQARLAKFANYKITMDLIKKAGVNENWKFMHCLPRHVDEVSDEVFYSPNSIVFDEAENRMYTVMAVMLTMLGKAGSI